MPIASRSPFFGRAGARVSERIATPGEWVDFLERIRLEQVYDGYADVLLVVKGRVFYSLSRNAGGALDAADAQAVGEAVEGRTAVLSDLYRASDGKIHRCHSADHHQGGQARCDARLQDRRRCVSLSPHGGLALLE